MPEKVDAFFASLKHAGRGHINESKSIKSQILKRQKNQKKGSPDIDSFLFLFSSIKFEGRNEEGFDKCDLI